MYDGYCEFPSDYLPQIGQAIAGQKNIGAMKIKYPMHSKYRPYHSSHLSERNVVPVMMGQIRKSLWKMWKNVNFRALETNLC